MDFASLAIEAGGAGGADLFDLFGLFDSLYKIELEEKDRAPTNDAARLADLNRVGRTDRFAIDAMLILGVKGE